mgnify:FL=1
MNSQLRLLLAPFVMIGCLGAVAARAASPGDETGTWLSRGDTLLLEGDAAGARRAYSTALGDSRLKAVERALARLRLAEALRQLKDFDAVKAELEAVANGTDLPHHVRQEARVRLAQFQLRHTATAAPAEDSARYKLPDLPRPALSLYVAARGDDTNPGTRERPFATLDRARDEIRARRKRGDSFAGRLEVVIGGGAYQLARTFRLESQDSGTAAQPVVYRAEAGERPVFSGGVRLTKLGLVKDPVLLGRLPDSSRGRVYEADLAANGVTRTWPLVLGGFSSGRGFKSHPVMELYCNGEPMRLARGPKEATLRVAEVCEPESEKSHGSVYSKVGRFRSVEPLPAAWREESDLWLYGYWFFGWADSYEKVVSVDPARQEITLAPPYHGYGYRAGQPFYAVNALSELDQPGEWHLDTARQRVCFWPPADPATAVIEISAADWPLVELKQVSHVRLEGLVWELGCTDGIRIEGGASCGLAGCVVRNLAGAGVIISGGSNHVLLSCDIHSLGRGGVGLSGGDRKTLTPGGHLVENCHIYNLSRLDRTYTPAVWSSGVGQRIRHNWFHQIPSSALRVGGNDNLVEWNEVNHVVLESDDQGGVDMWGNPTYLGNIYRFNFFHHIGNWRNPHQGPDCGQAGIRLDDAISGVLIYRNLFYRCGAGKLGFGGVQIHGGKDNLLDANVFAECPWAVSFSPWGGAHWTNFTRGPRQSAEINPELYAARYPEWSRLDLDLNANFIWRNLVLNCGPMLHRNQGGARPYGNLVVSNQLSFASQGGAYLIPRGKSATTGPALFGPDELGQIGLYRDAWRRDLPETLNRRLRADP